MFAKQNKTNLQKNSTQVENLTSEIPPQDIASHSASRSLTEDTQPKIDSSSTPNASSNGGKTYNHMKATNSENKEKHDSHSGRHTPQSHHDRLKRTIGKQTLLVAVATSTSLVIFFLGAFYAAISLLIPLDFLMNSLCVWFMFRFADGLWDKIVDFCDCCGCCGSMKDPDLTRTDTLSKIGSQGVVQNPNTATNQVGTTDLFDKPPKKIAVASSTPEISSQN